MSTQISQEIINILPESAISGLEVGTVRGEILNELLQSRQDLHMFLTADNAVFYNEEGLEIWQEDSYEAKDYRRIAWNCVEQIQQSYPSRLRIIARNPAAELRIDPMNEDSFVTEQLDFLIIDTYPHEDEYLRGCNDYWDRLAPGGKLFIVYRITDAQSNAISVIGGFANEKGAVLTMSNNLIVIEKPSLPSNGDNEG